MFNVLGNNNGWYLPSQSRIKDIISSGNFTIEDLLQESYDIVVSAANDPIVYNYLKDPAVLVKLFDYVLKEPVKRDDVPPEQIPELQRQLLLSTTACDVIAQSTYLQEAIIQDKKVLEIIFKGFKEFRSHLVFHRLTALFMALFSIGGGEVIEYAKAQQTDFIRNMITKIGVAPTEDIQNLIKLFLKSNAKVPGIIEWLANEHLLRNLITNLSPTCNDVTIRETVIILQEVTNDIIAKSQLSDDHDNYDEFELNFSSSEEEKQPKPPSSASILFKQYEDAETLDLLFTCLFSSQIAQIFALPFVMNVIAQGVFPSLLNKSLNYMDNFLNILKPVLPESNELGFGRLTIMKFLIMLLKLENPKITSLLVEKGSFPLVLELFFIHRNNTVLHNLVLEYFTIGLSRNQFLYAIVSNSQLTNRIVDAWEKLNLENESRLKDQALSDHALSWLKKLFRNFKNEQGFPVEVAVRLQILKGSANWGSFGHLFKLSNSFMSVCNQISPDILYNTTYRDNWLLLVENERWKKFVDEVLRVYNAISSQKLDQDFSSDSESSDDNDE
jgi:hypothetical protein